MDDSLFGVDEEACSGCGLCQPACPQNAISMADNVLEQGGEALLVCERAIVETPGAYSNLALKCVHSQGLEQIAQFHQNGVRRLAVATGDCETCHYGGPASLDGHLETFNRLAENRGLPLIKSIDVNAASWQKRIKEKAQTGIADTGRRAFLHSLIAPVIDEGTGDEKPGALPGFLAMIGKIEGQALYVTVPDIDPKKCNGCDACINICPEKALTLVKDEQSLLQYSFHAHLCTGCGVCVDVCEVSAVSLSAMATGSASGLPLVVCTCRSCGARFHLPDKNLNSEPSIGKGDLCRICSKTNHNRKLFQVLT